VTSRPGRHLLLFAATVVCVFGAGTIYEYPVGEEASILGILQHLYLGWPFAVPLLAILVCHEFGHYFAAMYHRVPASLPFFIPLPPLIPTPAGLMQLSPFGTMGAVISMPSRIRSRNALLDIGAAGPLAGMVIAVPVVIIGLMTSEVKPMLSGGYFEGQCLLYSLLKHLVVGEIPPGYDVYLSSTAFAGWTGLLITMLNMLPVGQLDGGHIAYALFDTKQNRYGRVVHYGLIAAFVYNLAMYRDAATGSIWLLWFVLLALLRRAGGGVAHPPTDPGELSPMRRIIAAMCLLMFVVLFMPTPMRQADMFCQPAFGAVVEAAQAI
jgi:membrane-associated protease RseP (regulator of RpoE activity)